MTYKEYVNNIKTTVSKLEEILSGVASIKFVSHNFADFNKPSDLPAAFVRYDNTYFTDKREMGEDETTISIYLKNKGMDELDNLAILADVVEKLEDYTMDGTVKSSTIKRIDTAFEGSAEQKNLLTELTLIVNL